MMSKKVKLLFTVGTAMVLIVSMSPLDSEEEVFLRIGCQEIETLNFWGETGTSSPHVVHWFYPSLYYKKLVTLEPLPDMCTLTFEELRNSSPDGLIYTFVLRDDVQWDDGTPLTAHDFVFTYELITTLELQCVFGSSTTWISYVDYMKAKGPYTLELKLKQCTPLFEEYMLYFFAIPSHQFRPMLIEALGTEHPRETFLNMKVNDPISAGPFSFGQWEKGSYMKLVTNPTYYGKGRRVDIPGVGEIEEGPHYDGIILKFYPDLWLSVNEALADIQEGSINYLYWNLNAVNIAQLYENPYIAVETADQLSFYYLAPNCTRKPFDDVALRQALVYMVDKEFIVDRLWGKFGGVAHSVVVPAAGEWYNDNVDKFGSGMSREERFTKAKQILKKAGYTVPDVPYPEGVLILPNGEEMQPFEILTPWADLEFMRFTAGFMIQEWWRELGVPVTCRPASTGVMVEHVFEKRDFDWYILGWLNEGSGYPDYLFDIFSSHQPCPDYYNCMGYKNPQLDRYLTDLLTKCDRDERIEAAWKAQELVTKEVGYCPLYYRTINEAHRTDTFEGWFTQLGGVMGCCRTYSNNDPKSCLLYLKPIGKRQEENPETSAPPESTPQPEATPEPEGPCLGTILLVCVLTAGVTRRTLQESNTKIQKTN